LIRACGNAVDSVCCIADAKSLQPRWRRWCGRMVLQSARILCARHGADAGGASPLRALVMGIASRRQLRRREAGWEVSPRRSSEPTHRNRISGRRGGVTRQWTGTPNHHPDTRACKSGGARAKHHLEFPVRQSGDHRVEISSYRELCKTIRNGTARQCSAHAGLTCERERRASSTASPTASASAKWSVRYSMRQRYKRCGRKSGKADCGVCASPLWGMRGFLLIRGNQTDNA
jgi:hypothetical protein